VVTAFRGSRIGIGSLEEFGLQSRVECSRGECKRRIGEIKRLVIGGWANWQRSFWSPFQRAGAALARPCIGYGAVKTSERMRSYRPRYRKMRWWASRTGRLDGWSVIMANVRGLRSLKSRPYTAYSRPKQEVSLLFCSGCVENILANEKNYDFKTELCGDMMFWSFCDFGLRGKRLVNFSELVKT